MEEEWDELEVARELFKDYKDALNQEFQPNDDVKAAHDECISLATELLELGFVILSKIKRSKEIIACSDNDAVQTVITFVYDLALVRNEIPLRQPVAVAQAVSKVVGQATPPAMNDRVHSNISVQDEAWLNSVLNSLETDTPNTASAE